MFGTDHKSLYCLSFDVEWAEADVISDTVRLLDERGLKGTFFCTHAGISVPGHERAIHPNFCSTGGTSRPFFEKLLRDPQVVKSYDDMEYFHHVIGSTMAFCPEAKGTRGHCLFSDARLYSIYKNFGIQYDSTVFLPMAPHLRPIHRENDILLFPIYYMDHPDLTERHSDFDLTKLQVGSPGLKVFDFHPTLIFINAQNDEHYREIKPYYHKSGLLKLARRSGPGIRTLFLDLLDELANRKNQVLTLAELNEDWRRSDVIS